MTLSPCPLKPGLVCAATYELASASHCIGCPYLDRCDRALVIYHASRNPIATPNVPPNVGFTAAHPPTGDVKKCVTDPLLATRKGYVIFTQFATEATSPEAVR